MFFVDNKKKKIIPISQCSCSTAMFLIIYITFFEIWVVEKLTIVGKIEKKMSWVFSVTFKIKDDILLLDRLDL